MPCHARRDECRSPRVRPQPTSRISFPFVSIWTANFSTVTQHSVQVAETLFQRHPGWWVPASVPLGAHEQRTPIVFRIQISRMTGRRVAPDAVNTVHVREDPAAFALRRIAPSTVWQQLGNNLGTIAPEHPGEQGSRADQQARRVNN